MPDNPARVYPSGPCGKTAKYVFDEQNNWFPVEDRDHPIIDGNCIAMLRYKTDSRELNIHPEHESGDGTQGNPAGHPIGMVYKALSILHPAAKEVKGMALADVNRLKAIYPGAVVTRAGFDLLTHIPFFEIV